VSAELRDERSGIEASITMPERGVEFDTLVFCLRMGPATVQSVQFPSWTNVSSRSAARENWWWRFSKRLALGMFSSGNPWIFSPAESGLPKESRCDFFR
jgi:hypothetical protein